MNGEPSERRYSNARGDRAPTIILFTFTPWRLRITFMTTLSPAKARSNFTDWLKKAASGEEIGTRYGGKVFVLQPVEEEDTSYAEKEYGATKTELKRFAERMDAKIKKNRKAGKYKVFSGNIEDLVKD